MEKIIERSKKMKLREMNKMCDILYGVTQDIINMTETEFFAAVDIIKAAEKIGYIESERGACGDDIIIALIDSGFMLDGKPQHKYAAEILGRDFNPTEKEYKNASILWFAADVSKLISDEDFQNRLQAVLKIWRG